MGAVAFDFDQSLGELHIVEKNNYDKGIIEEIGGLIRVYKDGRVERPLLPSVPPVLAPNLGVTARDVYIDVPTNVWARIYVPKCKADYKFPLLLYFHGGGFCVGSTAWKCYNEFIGDLSSRAQCIIVSVNYRLAPENPLPAAYEDGIKALMWVKQQANGPSREYWTKYCNFCSIFIGGDSAGANISYNVALKLDLSQIRPLCIKGVILIQPFFSSENRTNSETIMDRPHNSMFNLTTTDAYWRLALPEKVNREHPWCNPIRDDMKTLENMNVMVCVAEEDILKDMNLELCTFLAKTGNKVKSRISQGVGHGFQVMDKSQLSQIRKEEMISDVVAFISS